MSLEQRFAAKVDEGIACWLWQGFVDRAGYGRIRLGGRDMSIGYAHRVSYELHVGEIPEGLELDHLCRNRSCVNPAHLEAVTHGENVRRGNAGVQGVSRATRTGRCRRGHDLAVHAYWRPDGRGFNCKQCRRERRKVTA